MAHAGYGRYHALPDENGGLGTDPAARSATVHRVIAPLAREDDADNCPLPSPGPGLRIYRAARLAQCPTERV